MVDFASIMKHNGNNNVRTNSLVSSNICMSDSYDDVSVSSSIESVEDLEKQVNIHNKKQLQQYRQHNHQQQQQHDKVVKKARRGRDCKVVEQVSITTGEVVRVYSSLSEAANILNISQGGISSCCLKNTKEFYGYTWRFYKGEPINDFIEYNANFTPILEVIASIPPQLKRGRPKSEFPSKSKQVKKSTVGKPPGRPRKLSTLIDISSCDTDATVTISKGPGRPKKAPCIPASNGLANDSITTSELLIISQQGSNASNVLNGTIGDGSRSGRRHIPNRMLHGDYMMHAMTGKRGRQSVPSSHHSNLDGTSTNDTDTAANCHASKWMIYRSKITEHLDKLVKNSNSLTTMRTSLPLTCSDSEIESFKVRIHAAKRKINGILKRMNQGEVLNGNSSQINCSAHIEFMYRNHDTDEKMHVLNSVLEESKKCSKCETMDYCMSRINAHLQSGEAAYKALEAAYPGVAIAGDDCHERYGMHKEMNSSIISSKDEDDDEDEDDNDDDAHDYQHGMNADTVDNSHEVKLECNEKGESCVEVPETLHPSISPPTGDSRDIGRFVSRMHKGSMTHAEITSISTSCKFSNDNGSCNDLQYVNWAVTDMTGDVTMLTYNDLIRGLNQHIQYMEMLLSKQQAAHQARRQRQRMPPALVS